MNLSALQTGIALRDKHTKEHLETTKFPTAQLISAQGSGGKGKATIKVKGIEKPVVGTYKVQNGQFVANFPVKLSDFNINDVKYMGVGVEDEATVMVTLPVKADAARGTASAKH